ncbi:MAG: VCBS repeat-containing protein [Nannocystaceae bacterium]
MPTPPRSRRRWVAGLGLTLALGCGVEDARGTCDGLGALCGVESVTIAWTWEEPVGRFVDLDGGGALDVVLASRSGLAIGWGERSYDAQLLLSPGGARDVELVDLDDDGDLEVLVAFDAAPRLRVVEGAGVGAAAVTRTADLEGAPQALWSGPLAGREGATIVAATHGPAGISVLDRGLAVTQSHAFGRSLVDLAAGDLDGDQALDVVVADVADGALQVLLGDGAGGLRAPTRVTSAPAPTSLALVDLEGDAALDALVGNRGGGVVWLHRGLGLGELAPAEAIAFAATTKPRPGVAAVEGSIGAPWAVLVEDHGVVAVQAPLEDPGARRVASEFLVNPARLHGAPEGIFAVDAYQARRLEGAVGDAFVEIWRAEVETDAMGYRVAAGDVDDDGDVDLVLAVDRRFEVYLAEAGGWSLVSTVELADVGEAIALGDVNGDGVVDLIVPLVDPESAVLVALGDGAGGFVQGPISLVPAAPRNFTRVRDLDRVDLAIVGGPMERSAGARVLRFDELGSVIEVVELLSTSTPTQIAAADVDGDGDDDLIALVVDDLGQGSLALLHGDGAGGWAEAGTISLAGIDPEVAPLLGYSGLIVGDFDLDARGDALLATKSGYARVMGLDDPPTAALTSIDAAAVDCAQWVIHDAIGDAAPEVICGGPRGPSILGDLVGGLTVVQGNDIFSVTGGSALAVGGDGMLRSVEFNNRGLTVSEIGLAPTLKSTDEYGVPDPISLMAVGDLDGDARPEIVAVAESRLGVIWEPLAAAGSPGLYEASADVIDLMIVDVDGDPGGEIVLVNRRGEVEVHDLVDRRLESTATIPLGGYAVGGIAPLARADGPADVVVAVVDELVGTQPLRILAIPRAPEGGLAEAPQILAEGDVADFYVQLTAGDFDGDGYGDVAALLSPTARLRIVWGSADRRGETLEILTTQPHALGAGDVDGDGVDELLVEDLGDVIAYSLADRAVAPRRILGHGSGPEVRLLAGDLDHDGAAELLRLYPGRVELLRGPVDINDPRGRLTLRAADPIVDVAHADLDGDGIDDVIAVADGALRIWPSAPRP